MSAIRAYATDRIPVHYDHAPFSNSGPLVVYYFQTESFGTIFRVDQPHMSASHSDGPARRMVFSMNGVHFTITTTTITTTTTTTTTVTTTPTITT